MEQLVKDNGYRGPATGIAIAVVVVVVGLIVIHARSAPGAQASVNSLNVLDSAASAFETMDVGGHTYDLDGVDFMFAPDGQKTQVRIQMNGVTRDGAPVRILPFRLGAYDGACSVADEPKGVVEPLNSPMLAFSQCVTGDTTREFAVYEQEDSIVTYTREVTAQAVMPFEQIQAIDLGELIH